MGEGQQLLALPPYLIPPARQVSNLVSPAELCTIIAPAVRERIQT